MKINSKEIRHVVKQALNNGWVIHRYTKNKHIILKHIQSNRLVTVSNKSNDTRVLKEIKRDLKLT